MSADKVGKVATLDGDHLSGRHASCSSKLLYLSRVGGAGSSHALTTGYVL